MGSSEDDDNDQHFGGLSSLIRLTGAQIPARARYIGGAVLNASLASVTFGLTFCFLGSALPMGPLVPHMLGSCAGYALGMRQCWKTSKETALLVARQCPTLLAHAIMVTKRTTESQVVPRAVLQASLQKLQQENEEAVNADNKKANILPLTLDLWMVQGGLGRLTACIAAVLSCRGEVEAIQQQQRQHVVDEIVANTTGTTNEE